MSVAETSPRKPGRGVFGQPAADSDSVPPWRKGIPSSSGCIGLPSTATRSVSASSGGKLSRCGRNLGTRLHGKLLHPQPATPAVRPLLRERHPEAVVVPQMRDRRKLQDQKATTRLRCPKDETTRDEVVRAALHWVQELEARIELAVGTVVCAGAGVKGEVVRHDGSWRCGRHAQALRMSEPW